LQDDLSLFYNNILSEHQRNEFFSFLKLKGIENATIEMKDKFLKEWNMIKRKVVKNYSC